MFAVWLEPEQDHLGDKNCVCSVQGWHTAVKPTFEVVSLERRAVGASVPLPKTVIRYILSAVLPRVLQRKLLGMLPQELGQYLLDSGQGGRVAGGSLWTVLLKASCMCEVG